MKIDDEDDVDYDLGKKIFAISIKEFSKQTLMKIEEFNNTHTPEETVVYICYLLGIISTLPVEDLMEMAEDTIH